MKEMKHCYVFFSSPGDIKDERKAFPKILEDINATKAISLGIQLVPCTSETALIGWGNPQGIINKNVKECDLFVMLLWHRWGSPTGGGYDSGTHEEFCITHERFEKSGRKEPHILLYFRKPDESQLLDSGEQFKKVQAFKKKVEEEKILYFAHYDKVVEWKERLKLDLCKWLDKIPLTPSVPPVAPSPPDAETKATLEAVTKELEKEKNLRQTTERKLKVHALRLADDAWKAAQDGRLTEAEEKFARAREDYESPSILNLYGHFLDQIGDLKGAESAYQRALDIWTAGKDKEGIAVACGNLGNVYSTRGDLAKAEKMHKKSLELAGEVGNKEVMANQYCNLGIIYETRGDLAKAEEMHNKALKIDEELGRKGGLAQDYGNLGIVYETRGDLAKAEEMYKKSLELAEEVGNKEVMANQYGNLGNVYFTRGEIDKAEEMYNKALKIDEEIGRKEGMAQDYRNLGIVYKKQGALVEAEEMYRKALALFKELGIPSMVAKTEKLIAGLKKP